ncbi:hypothetical protein C3941_12045 [Kaistia algarum]|uniref:hypothetical protein n=1 Tax=Kaistia algarum TaxID=2083279 RepID=UPI000CE81BBD|nr:hypothetical protein [Kaistia algarum]MCX5515079.1 hypothetical protein [Kaistia algarum]PPE79810.1 hypothetical protein C3941_12045 [Kaistia algarum]
MRGLVRLIILLIVVVGGYWAYYVFASADPNDKFGVMINEKLPLSAREYACTKLKERFGDINAPNGCGEFAEWAPKPVAPAPASVPAAN